MKKLIYLMLLFAPIFSRAQISDANLNLEADTIRTETHAGKNTAQRVGRMFKNIIANKYNMITPLAIANGGTGTSSPNLVAGTNISITGAWPNQTINQSGGGGITNSAPNGYLMLSNGTNAVSSGIQSSNSGEINKIQTGGGAFTSMSGLSGVNGEIEIANNSTTMDTPLRISHYSSAPNTGVGSAIDFASTTASSGPVNKIGSRIGNVATNVGSGTEAFDFVIYNMTGGAAAAEAFRVKANGTVLIANQNWQSVSSFINFWSGNTLRYRKDGDGTVHLSGAITFGGGFAQVTNTGIFPNASSANGALKAVVYAAGSNQFCYVQIGNNGQMSVLGATLTNGDVISVEGLSYSTN